MTLVNPMHFGPLGHDSGDKGCMACMMVGNVGETPYPKPCSCGGLLHADNVDEDDGSNEGRVHELCDRCLKEKVLPGA